MMFMAKHCLDQLTEEQVWWRPKEEMNSIGNLILHLMGNVRQWIVAGIGGQTDVRKRPAEFSERGPVNKAVLLLKLETVVAQAEEMLRKASAEEMLSERRIQGFNTAKSLAPWIKHKRTAVMQLSTRPTKQ